MKKIALIFLLSIYTLSVLGVGVRQFYCCGKLKSTSITVVQEVKEKCSKSDAMKGCCKTKFQNFKVKNSHVSTDGFTGFVKHFTDLHLFTPSFETITLVNKPMLVANASHAPPPDHGVAIYTLHCVYRI
jgi:hypothetical protein